jgi:hypothetical protein
LISTDTVGEVVDGGAVARAALPYVPERKVEERPEAVYAASIANFWDQPYDPYYKTLIAGLYSYSEPAFFRQYEECYTTNPYGKFLVDYVVTRTIGDGFHFEGPGANVVEQFFRHDHTRSKLTEAFRDTVKFGSGFMDLKILNSTGRLSRTDVLDPFTFQIEIDDQAGSPTYGLRKYYQPRKDAKDTRPTGELNAARLFHFMIEPTTYRAWPMSLMRPNIVFLTALMDSGGDVMAAIKRTGYAPLVARLNMKGMNPAEKKKAMEAFGESLKQLQSSTNNFVIDKEHEIDLLGRGGGNAKLLPINDLLEPWIGICLMNYAVPLGLLLQGGANKSIVETQREDARISLGAFRGLFEEQVMDRIVPHITNREVRMVWNKPPASSPETRAEMAAFLDFFKAGAVSREFLLDYFDIEDHGTTFFAPPLDPNQELMARTQKEMAKSAPKPLSK